MNYAFVFPCFNCQSEQKLCFTYERQHSSRIKRTGCGVSLPRLEYHLHPLMATQAWEIYQNSLYFSFLMCTMGIIISQRVAVKIT